MKLLAFFPIENSSLKRFENRKQLGGTKLFQCTFILGSKYVFILREKLTLKGKRIVVMVWYEIMEKIMRNKSAC